jgi:hypothetical protein
MRGENISQLQSSSVVDLVARDLQVAIILSRNHGAAALREKRGGLSVCFLCVILRSVSSSKVRMRVGVLCQPTHPMPYLILVDVHT